MNKVFMSIIRYIVDEINDDITRVGRITGVLLLVIISHFVMFYVVGCILYTYFDLAHPQEGTRLLLLFIGMIFSVFTSSYIFLPCILFYSPGRVFHKEYDTLLKFHMNCTSYGIFHMYDCDGSFKNYFKESLLFFFLFLLPTPYLLLSYIAARTHYFIFKYVLQTLFRGSKNV